MPPAARPSVADSGEHGAAFHRRPPGPASPRLLVLHFVSAARSVRRPRAAEGAAGRRRHFTPAGAFPLRSGPRPSRSAAASRLGAPSPTVPGDEAAAKPSGPRPRRVPEPDPARRRPWRSWMGMDGLRPGPGPLPPGGGSVPPRPATRRRSGPCCPRGPARSRYRLPPRWAAASGPSAPRRSLSFEVSFSVSRLPSALPCGVRARRGSLGAGRPPARPRV